MSFGTVVLSLVTPIIKLLFNAVTPTLRSELDGFIKGLYAKALASPSPWDDFAIGLLATLVGVSVSDVIPATSGGVTMPAEVKAAIMGSSFNSAPSVVVATESGRVFDPTVDSGP